MPNLCRFWLPLSLSVALAAAAAQPSNDSLFLKPDRVLLVVDQWSDPASQVIQSEKDPFQPVAALLKAWSVPFDIFRLDQQTFGAAYLFDRSGRVRYSTVLWLADASSYERKMWRSSPKRSKAAQAYWLSARVSSIPRWSKS